MHIAPELLENRAKNLNCSFDATVAADVYAIGCVVNQIYFRQALFDELSLGEVQDKSGQQNFGKLVDLRVVLLTRKNLQ